MKSILVTGASGLVGQAIFNNLQNSKDFSVVGLTHQGKSDIKNYVKMDLENIDLECLDRSFDFIIHCAGVIPAEVHTQLEAAQINRKIDDNIIDFAIKNDSGVIFMSSISLYGRIKEWVNEDSQLNPLGAYALEKLRTEKRIQAEVKRYYILRLSSPYGVRMQQKNVLNLFKSKAIKGEDIAYFGLGERTQNFIHVNDIAGICHKCLDSDKYGIYNVASKSDTSMKNLAEIFVRQSKIIRDIDIKAIPSELRDPQEDIRTLISIDKLKKELEYESFESIEDGVEELLRL